MKIGNKKFKGIKFKNKIFIKLLSYFGLSLLLFSIVIGSIFGYIYIQNTVSLHKKDLVERAYKISTTLSKMWFEDGNENLENKDRKPPSKETSSEKPVRREKPKIVGNINGKAFENNVIENIRKNETKKSPEEKNSKKLLDEKHFHRHRIVDEKDNNVKIFKSMRIIEDIAMGEVWIVDAKTGNIVQGRNEKGRSFSYLKLPPNAEETIKKAISGETTTTENFNDYLNENSITVAVPIKNGQTIEGVVLLHSPVKYMSSALKSGIYTLIFSILVALILASISAVWLSISFTKPLNKIRDTTTELAKGNYEVVLSNFKHLFGRANWRVKLEVFNYSCVFFWFNFAIVLSDLIFLANVLAICLNLFFPDVRVPFAFDADNIYIAQFMLFNWILMIGLYLMQIMIALASQFGQATTKQIWLALVAYFTYAQMFIVVSVDSISSIVLDKVLRRKETKWVKTKRFAG